MKKASAPKRRYDSPGRRQQSAETLDSILANGAKLVRGLLKWDLSGLTAGAIAERAGISERTVRRYFHTDRQLHDAVMARLVQESGIALSELKLSEFEQTAARMFEFLSSFSAAPALPKDSTFAVMDRERVDAMLSAVAQAAPKLAEPERRKVGAALDLLWHLPSYERMVSSWELEPEAAIATLTWMIGLVKDAVRKGRAP